MIVGIDEVGRGAWAGPLCVGAVALDGCTIEGLTDSKLLSKKKRLQYSHIIKLKTPYIGVGWVSAKDIDKIGISAALKLAAQRAFAQVDNDKVDQIIIDGTIALIDDPRVTLMKKADLLIPSVSAASVVAKVARDQYMARCHDLFGDYKWNSNVGYGAKVHHEAIQAYGVTPLHRMSFAPMKAENGITRKAENVTSTSIGGTAETAACLYLEQQGYEIIERNWKTKWCEIDIIAKKDNVIHFVEVKYRKNDRYGGGMAAITSRKLKQMNFAARLWLAHTPPTDARLSAMDVSGIDYEIMEFLEQVAL